MAIRPIHTGTAIPPMAMATQAIPTDTVILPTGPMRTLLGLTFADAL